MSMKTQKSEWWGRFTWSIIGAVIAWSLTVAVLLAAVLHYEEDEILATTRTYADMLCNRGLPAPHFFMLAGKLSGVSLAEKTIGREKAAADSLSLHGESGLFRPLGLEAGAGTSDRSAWQRWALQRLQEGQSRLETLTFSDGEEYYCVLRPLRADSTCVSCHRPGSFMPGTLTGGLQIRIPMRDAKEAGAIAIGRISVVVAGLWLIVVLCIVVAGIGMRWRVLAHLQAEKLFKQVWDNSFDGMRVMDENGIVSRVNPSYCRMMNVDRHDAEGKPYPVVYEQGRQKSILTTYVSQMQKGEFARRSVHQLRLWDGSIHWFELSNSRLELSDSGVTLLSIVRDVTENKEKEIALRQSEENYRLLFEGSPIGIFRMQMDGRMLAANPALARMFGYQHEDELLDDVNDLQAQIFSLRSFRDDMLEQLRAGVPLVQAQPELRRRDGTVFHGKVIAKMVADAGESRLHVIGTVEDISDRRAAEIALERKMRSEELLSDISNRFFRTTPEHFGMTVRDSVKLLAQFIGATRGYMNLFLGGFFGSNDVAEWCSENEIPFIGSLEGRPLSVLNWGLTTASENQYAVIENAEAIPPAALAERSLWEEFRLGLGLIVPILREESTIGVLIFTGPEKGEDWHYQDIHLLRMAAEILVTAIERRRSEVNLRQSEKRLRDLTENMLDVVCQLDSSGVFTYASPSYLKLFGRKYDDVIGRKFAEHLHPQEVDDLSFALAPDAPLFAKSRTECRYRHIDGHYLWLEIFSTVMLNEEGQPVGVVMGMRDITERKVADEKINSSLREKEVLLKEIHHRVKNNLQVISSLLSLQASYIADPLTRELFGESQNRVRSMALIHEKLYQSEDFVAIDFAEYISGLAGYLYRAYAINPEKIVLTIDVTGIALGMFSAVPCGLIINELLSNALKYAFPEGRNGSITIQLTKIGDEHLLRIADDGIGLPEHMNLECVESLGLQLVETLTHQILGRMIVKRTPGTEFSIYFKG